MDPSLHVPDPNTAADTTDTRAPAASLTIKNVPRTIRQTLVIRELNHQIPNRLANVYFKYPKRDGPPGLFMNVIINFHTIMEAEATLAEKPRVKVCGMTYPFEWSIYRAIPRLVLGFFDDFPVAELLQLLQPYAVIKRMFKVPEHPTLILVHTGDEVEARVIQRTLHGSVFRGSLLYVGSELPGFQRLRGDKYFTITDVQPTIPELHYEAQ